MRYLKLVLCILGLSSAIYGQGFVEKNSLHLSPESSIVSNISESEFFRLMEVAQTIYDRYIEENNLKSLSIDGRWQDNTVNAYFLPQLQGNFITVYGGIARRPELTLDGLAFVVCHEIGHGYGGKPDKRAPLFKVSVEGQADYYGARSCLPKIFAELPEVATSKSGYSKRCL